MSAADINDGLVTGFRCHAGAAHGWAMPHGLSGWLCSACWSSVERILRRMR